MQRQARGALECTPLLAPINFICSTPHWNLTPVYCMIIKRTCTHRDTASSARVSYAASRHQPMVSCIFMLGRGPSLNRGVTGARFGNLVLYCLGAGKWVLFQSEDEIRLCQEYWPLCLLPSLLEAYCRREEYHSISPLSQSCIDFPLCHFHYIWRFLLCFDFHVL